MKCEIDQTSLNSSCVGMNHIGCLGIDESINFDGLIRNHNNFSGKVVTEHEFNNTWLYL